MRVGTSKKKEVKNPVDEDHPHACGDKSRSVVRAVERKGSSPCVWGQVQACMNIIPAGRIIPMRVGTRYTAYYTTQAIEDHPHACGDKSIVTPATFVVRGSSPCVWGQESTTYTQKVRMRIIPMRVGTRQFCLSERIKIQDHPHACGDKSFNYSPMAHIQGSSPCVWGQENINLDTENVQRIIPMRVGTSKAYKMPLILKRDHPHACGDKTLGKATDTYQKGSSPCVWGQVLNSAKQQPPIGIIPMRVGTRS